MSTSNWCPASSIHYTSPDIPTYTDQAPPSPQSQYTADTLVIQFLLDCLILYYVDTAHCVVCQHYIDELVSHIILFMHTASARIHAIWPKFPPLPLASSPHPSLHPMLGCGAHICKAERYTHPSCNCGLLTILLRGDEMDQS